MGHDQRTVPPPRVPAWHAALLRLHSCIEPSRARPSRFKIKSSHLSRPRVRPARVPCALRIDQVTRPRGFFFFFFSFFLSFLRRRFCTETRGAHHISVIEYY